MPLAKAATFIGRPCKYGHSGERYVSKAKCVQCARQWTSKNPVSHARSKAKYRSANAEKVRQGVADWKKANKSRHAAHTRKREAAKIRRTPAWADHNSIQNVYDLAAEMTSKTGIRYEVDHEIPLQGIAVSGLHVYENLQVIPAIENWRKGNRFPQ